MRKLVIICIGVCVPFAVALSEEISGESSTTVPQKKMRFFNLDLHISVIADVKNVFEHFGHEVVNWSISGHTWVFGKQRDVVDIVNENTWAGLDREMSNRFYERYKEYLSQFDGFIVTHNAVFALLYEKFNKPIIVVNSTRYEGHYTRDPKQWNMLNEYLREGIENNKIFIVSNNKGDAHYLKYYSGIETEVIPSLCLYTNARYRGIKSQFTSHALWGQDKKFDKDWDLVSKKIKLFTGLPWAYQWQALYDLRGVVHFPYNVSTMSLFEQYSANVPVFFPSKSFLFKLHKLYPNSILSQLSFLREPDFRVLKIAIDEPNNVNNPEIIKQWIDLADYYDTDKMPYIQYFDSFDELQHLLKTVDCRQISRKMKSYNKVREQAILSQWANLLQKVSVSAAQSE